MAEILSPQFTRQVTLTDSSGNLIGQGSPLPVTIISGGSGGSSVDREFVTTTYIVKTAFIGASVGDIITATQIIDVSITTPTTITTIWRNQTTATDLTSIPSFSNLSLEGTSALTDTQLRASAVPVTLASTTVTNFPTTQTITGSVIVANNTQNSGSVDSNTLRVTLASNGPGATSLNSIDVKTPALDSNRQPVIPSMASGGNISVQTAVTGTNYTAFASQACKQLTISNQSGTVVEVRQGAAGVALQIPTGAFYTFFGITNTNQLEVRRTDVSNTQVTLTARWEA
jgi:hypothetical protein